MVVYAAYRNGVWRVDPATGDASEADGFADRSVECLAAGPDAVYVGTVAAGLWRSRDGPDEFERVAVFDHTAASGGPGSATDDRLAVGEESNGDPVDAGSSGDESEVGRHEENGDASGAGRREENGDERRGATDADDERPTVTTDPCAATDTGVEPDRVTAVTVDAAGRVWAGTEPSRVYVSADGGTTWRVRDGVTALDSATEWSFPPRPHTHHVRWLTQVPGDTRRWYVAVEAGALVRTVDDGATWRDRVPDGPRDTHTVATHPDRPETALVAAGDGYAETTDGGDSWRFPTDGLEHGYCWSVATPPDDPDAVVVSAARSARAAHTASRADTHLYRRDRTTGEWTRLVDRGVPTGEGVTRPVVARGRDDGELFALSNHGLFRTTDAGDSWRAVPVAWPDRVAETTARGLVVRA